jgi:hypothetical protein
MRVDQLMTFFAYSEGGGSQDISCHDIRPCYRDAQKLISRLAGIRIDNMLASLVITAGSCRAVRNT